MKKNITATKAAVKAPSNKILKYVVAAMFDPDLHASSRTCSDELNHVHDDNRHKRKVFPVSKSQIRGTLIMAVEPTYSTYSSYIGGINNLESYNIRNSATSLSTSDRPR